MILSFSVAANASFAASDSKSPRSHRRELLPRRSDPKRIQNGSVVAETLGGAASFISNVLDSSSVSCDLVSKVGHDFRYEVTHSPIVVPEKETTVFEAYFDMVIDGISHADRVLKRVSACDPIRPSDIPDSRFDFGMAVGVGGEILPETLEKMVEICDVVAVDIQALIRAFDPVDGAVKLVDLKGSVFYHILHRIGFLKVALMLHC